MNYELAKELKDNGFVWEEMDNLTTSRVETFPTLSELIEACGTPFALKSEDNNLWWSNNDVEGFACEVGGGSSPEEAVARLWLALNKK